jgi:transcriptional regulator with GAF, ATPase, and Fis domain
VEIHSADAAADPRFGEMGESVCAMAGQAVLVAPLHDADAVYGAIYLDRRGPLDFTGEARRFLGDVAEIAGLFLRRALERDALQQQNRALERDLFARHDFQGIVTQDPGVLEVLRTVAQVAGADATVLVRGETGTGKELIARALHVNGPRRGKPLVALHCTALPSTILESELFGHARGAFTGADKHRAGRIASAHGGTLFLDEIAEIPLDLQAKLLRFLQFGEIQRLGSDRTETVDVRVVAATHRDLAALVRDGRFRQDLYYRLNVLEIVLPPLRERRRDVALLLDYFLRKHWKRPGEAPRWTPAAEHALAVYEYPGNVRELAHLVERACLLARSSILDLDLLPPEISVLDAPPGPAAAGSFERYTADELEAARDAAVAGAEDGFLRGLMKLHGGNVSQAARSSGLHRTYLHKLLARHRPKGG